MGRVLRRGTAAVALLALTLSGLAAVPALADVSDPPPLTATLTPVADTGAGDADSADSQDAGAHAETGQAADPELVEVGSAPAGTAPSVPVSEVSDSEADDDDEPGIDGPTLPHFSPLDDSQNPEGGQGTVTPGGPGEGGGTEAPAEVFELETLEIAGMTTVGQTLTSTIEFTLVPDYLELQWFANGDPIDGATGETLVLTNAQVGKWIWLGVYAERDDFEEAIEAGSDDLGPVTAAGAVDEEFAILSVTIAGQPTVGQTLTSAVKFSHEPDFTGYLWFADDEFIEGAESDSLVLTEDLVGKTIVLAVYAGLANSEDGAVALSNEIGPVVALPVVVEPKPDPKPTPKPTPTPDKDKETEKDSGQKTETKKPVASPPKKLPNTGANASGALIAGASLLVLGAGALAVRRRMARD